MARSSTAEYHGGSERYTEDNTLRRPPFMVSPDYQAAGTSVAAIPLRMIASQRATSAFTCTRNHFDMHARPLARWHTVRQVAILSCQQRVACVPTASTSAIATMESSKTIDGNKARGLQLAQERYKQRLASRAAGNSAGKSTPLMFFTTLVTSRNYIQ